MLNTRTSTYQNPISFFVKPLQKRESPSKKLPKDYRFGFNGKEMDNETYGTGNEYDYGFRIYNPRLGKFLSVDPLTREFPFYSPYQYASNMPVTAVDIDGLESSKTGINGNEKPGTPKSDCKPLQDNLQEPAKPTALVPPASPQLPNAPPAATPSAPGPNIYSEQSIPFNKTQTAYLPVEGVGVSGSYNVNGVVNVKQTSAGQWQATIGASGSTPASGAGNVTFGGNAEVLQNGKVVSSAPLTQPPSGASIYETGKSPIGTTTLQLPNSGTVQVRVNAGYSIQVPEGGSLPMPSRTSIIVNIPTAPIIQANP